MLMGNGKEVEVSELLDAFVLPGPSLKATNRWTFVVDTLLWHFATTSDLTHWNVLAIMFLKRDGGPFERGRQFKFEKMVKKKTGKPMKSRPGHRGH